MLVNNKVPPERYLLESSDDKLRVAVKFTQIKELDQIAGISFEKSYANCHKTYERKRLDDKHVSFVIPSQLLC